MASHGDTAVDNTDGTEEESKSEDCKGAGADSESSYAPSDSSNEESEDDGLGLYDKITEMEVKDCTHISKYTYTHNVDDCIFTPAEMDNLKNKEKSLIERNGNGYYLYKVCHLTLY